MAIKFKVGDKVKLIGSAWQTNRVNRIATITEVRKGSDSAEARIDDTNDLVYVWDNPEDIWGAVLVEDERRPLRVGDRIRLTGSAWDSSVKNKIQVVTKVLEPGHANYNFYEAEFMNENSRYTFVTTRYDKGDENGYNHYEEWGCELVEDDDDLIDVRIDNLSITANPEPVGKIIVRVHGSSNVISALLDDEQLDELTTVLLYIKMERDKLK